MVFKSTEVTINSTLSQFTRMLLVMVYGDMTISTLLILANYNAWKQVGLKLKTLNLLEKKKKKE